MARVGVRFEFVPDGFQAVLASAAPLVEAEAEAIAARAGRGVRARATQLTRFGSGPRPGAVVSVAEDEARTAGAARARLDRALPG